MKWIATWALVAFSPSIHALAASNQPTTDSVVTIITVIDARGDKKSNIGAGFIVGNSDIVTAYHVVAYAATVEIIIADENRTHIPAEVVRIDPAADLALLHVAQKVPPPMVLESRVPVPREPLLMIGNALGMPHSTYIAHTVISTLLQVYQLNNGQGDHVFDDDSSIRTTPVLQLAGDIYDGMSGGAVVDEAGRVVGMVSGSLESGSGYGWAIPSERITLFLGAPEDPRPPPWLPVPFKVHGRSLETLVTKNTKMDDVLGTYLRDINDLSAANEQADLNAAALAVMLDMTGNALQGATATWPKDATDSSDNRDVYLIQAESNLPLLDPYLEEFRAALVRRYQATERLRTATGALRQLVNRQNLDPLTHDKIEEDVRTIINNHTEVATDTFERRNGIDEQSLIEALSKIAAAADLDMLGLGEIRQLFLWTRICASAAKQYESGEFLSLSAAEIAFYKDASSALNSVSSIVIYEAQ